MNAIVLMLLQAVPDGMPDRWVQSAFVVGAVAVGYFLLKRELTKIVVTVDRIPAQAWFDDVHEAMKRVPSQQLIERIYRDFDSGVEHDKKIAAIEMRLASQDQRLLLLEQAKRD